MDEGPEIWAELRWRPIDGARPYEQRRVLLSRGDKGRRYRLWR
jgi:hypothetical protein